MNADAFRQPGIGGGVRGVNGRLDEFENVANS